MMKPLCLLVATSVLAIAQLSGNQIASVVGSYPNDGIDAIEPNFSPAFSFTTTLAFSNVSISISSGGGSGTAYLTTSIGPGTTSAAQVASANLSLPSGLFSYTSTNLTLFSGLTLPPNTYYVSFSSTTTNPPGSGLAIVAQNTPVVAAGIKIGGALYATSIPTYSPAASYQPQGSVGLWLPVLTMTGTQVTLPLLTISSTHNDNFTQGQIGATYSLRVGNGALGTPTVGPVTVTETLPAGLTLVAMSGAGWNCSSSSCTRSDVLGPGASYPAIVVTADVAPNAPAQVTNVVRVSGGGSISNGGTDVTTIGPLPTPSISLAGVVNSASNTLGPVAPGSIATAYGAFGQLAPSTSPAGPWPTTLAGLTMQFGGVRTPLYYVSTGQVNFQVPWELAGQNQTSLTATLSGQTSSAFEVNLAAFAPGIFSMNGQSTGPGAILDQSYRLVNSSNPATAGSSIIQIFCTGLGSVTNQPPTGAAAPTNPLAVTTTTPMVAVGGVAAPVLYSGLAPGSIGLYQNRTPGVIDIFKSAGPVTISIGQPRTLPSPWPSRQHLLELCSFRSRIGFLELQPAFP